MPELTGPQVISKVAYAEGVPLMSTKKLRRMRKDPVISLVRQMFFAGIYSGEWKVVGPPEEEEKIKFVEEQFWPIRRHLLATGSLGCFDFGWQPYEKVYEIDALGRTVIRKIKQLVQEAVDTIEDIETGAFLGLQADVEIPLEKSLVIAFDVEGTNWKGQSILENAEEPYDSSRALSDAAKRYDSKMAGAHWVIRYPDGQLPFNGVLTPCDQIAAAILANLQSSGSIAIPISAQQFDMAKEGWDITLITAQGANISFEGRFDYLDKSKARALGFPERTILEGTHGTLAEAGAHQEFVITLIEYRHACLLEYINWHLLNQLLELNFGSDYKNVIYIEALPLDDVSKKTLAAVYDKILTSPDGMLNELAELDIPEITQSLGIPRVNEE